MMYIVFQCIREVFSFDAKMPLAGMVFNLTSAKCDTMELLLIIFIAFFVAILFSLLGLGGAIIYTPLFYWSGLPLLTAIPMALFLNMITTASSSVTYLRRGIIDTRIALPIIITSILGAFAGSYFARIIDRELIIFILSISLLFAGLRILFLSARGLAAGISGNKRVLVGASSGFIIGVVSSLAGIGGGTFIVPLLLVLGLETKKAVATSSMIVTFISLSGFSGHIIQGVEDLDTGLLLYAGVAAFIGAQAGSRIIFRRVSSGMIEKMFALVLLLAGLRLLYGLS